MLSTPELPNLAGVITLSDVKQKGSGSYAADYVPWAKVMQLLNEKANGWLPELIKDTNGELVHKAPNGTGICVCQASTRCAICTSGTHYKLDGKCETWCVCSI